MALGFSNPAAETLLRRDDGLLVRNGRLRARQQADERKLTTAVSKACKSPAVMASSSQPTTQPGASALLSIWRNDKEPPYRASIFPLRRQDAVRGLTRDATAVLFVDDPNDDAKPARPELFSHAFRLTPAEARLAIHLASGASLTEAADEFGVTHNTVRAQLRSIFDKTDTHRQADLLRLLQNSRSLRIALS
jgi:DNA-binding CsgD family transcriptional regulator